MALRLVYTCSVVQEALSAQDDSEELANRALLVSSESGPARHGISSQVHRE